MAHLVKIRDKDMRESLLYSHIRDLAGLTGYAGVTYFKQLEGFVGGIYAIAYSKYVNTNVIHAYPYCVF